MTADLKYAFRLLRRNPGFTLVVVLLLALGIGLNTAMFTILDAWLLEPLHFPNADRLAIILKSEVKRPTEPKIFASYRDWQEWARQSRSFASIAGVFWRSFEAKGGGDDVFGMIVTANLFDTLGVKPERGRTFRPEDVDGPPVAVIGHEFWQNHFGGARDIIGRTLPLASKTYQIIGVMPAGFGLRMINQATDTQFYALIQRDEARYRAGEAGPIAAIGRLKDGVSLATAQAELARIQRELDQREPDNPKGYTVLVTNLQKDNTRDVRASLWLSAGAVGFVLLTVCANVGSLLLGRTLRRSREMAIRAALGSGRRRILRQLLTESAVVAALGGAAGVLLAYAAVRIFAAVNPFLRMPPNAIALDWRALGFTLLLSLVSCVIFGLAPAFQAARADLNDALKASGRSLTGGQGAFRARMVLVAGQVALSLVLVIGAALMMETLARLESHPLGFRTAGVSVLQIRIPRERWSDLAGRRLLYDRLLRRLPAMPGVEAAAISNTAPLGIGIESRISIEGRPEPREELAEKAGHQAVSAGYFETLRIPLLSGRSFSERDDEKSDKVVIINQSAARRWFGGARAVGQRVKLHGDSEWRTVVGVAGDTAYSFFNVVEWLSGPRVFIPAKQMDAENSSPVSQEIYTVIRGGMVTAAAARDLLKSIDPEVRYDGVRGMQEIVEQSMQPSRLRSRLLGAVAAVSLLLASIGIYGIMAQSVIQRTHEIGIRMALGAQAGDLLRMVVGQGLRIAAAGIAAGVAGALALTRILASMLYGVKPTDTATYLLAAVVLLGAVVLAAFLPARAAVSVDPLAALRQE